MAQQTINVGTAPNDGTGDTLKASFTKCNQNFTDLYTNYAPLAAPVFTGDARAVTPATTDNDTSIATTAFCQNLNPRVLLQTVVPTASPFVVVGPFTTDFDVYEIDAYLKIAGGAGQNGLMQISYDGSSWVGINSYGQSVMYSSSDSSVVANSGGITNGSILTAILLGVSVHSAMYVKAFRPNVAGIFHHFLSQSAAYESGRQFASNGSGMFAGSTTAITHVRFFPADTVTNFDPSGFVKLYGLR